MTESKPSQDSNVMAAIILGALSIVGILVIFFSVRAASQRPPEITPTATRFRFLYIGTEPGFSTITPQPTATRIVFEQPTTSFRPTSRSPLGAPTATTVPFSPGGGGSFFPPQPSPTRSVSQPPAPTEPSFATKPPSSLFTPTFTPTIASVLAKYDDTYYAILYDGEWTSQTNVTGAYQNTLHISFTIENYALFTFVGQQVILTYQAGPSLGTIRIDLDGMEFEVSQASPQTQLVDWTSPILIMGTHDLIVEHLSGGSVNIDSITIPDVRTATPTP
ncbi:MAG: hypothetical protein ACOYYF_10370 [Chloroflexota bacterium]|nr:hypothetical protein [Chloroflexota bacterium]